MRENNKVVDVISEFILEMKDIKKHFSGIKALDGVDLKVKKGEVHALLGENGAGKSTLMKILGGAYIKDSGEIYMDGERVQISSPAQSQNCGIAVIYQEQALVECLTVADNIMLGRIPNRGGAILEKDHVQRAMEAMEQVGSTFDPHMLIKDLSVAQRQFVEIAKAISMDAKIIVMDEPTSVLTTPETEVLFKLIRRLKQQGRSMIYISHRLEELPQIADVCSVLKDGVYVGSKDMKDVTKNVLISMMTGREIQNIYPDKPKAFGEVRLEVTGLTYKKVFQNITFSVRAGEILGFSGLVGSGRSETARAIFGVDPIEAGSVKLDGTEIKVKSPGKALEQGIVYITEDRKGDGLLLGMSIYNNLSISTLTNWTRFGVIRSRQERETVSKYMEQLKVKCADGSQAVGELSGGNQQKVMIARAMLTGAKVIIIDEPTRGVDVGTKTEIYKIIRELADKGAAVLMISSELPEVIGMSDRVLVMHNGKISGEVLASEATEEKILLLATGGNEYDQSDKEYR